MNHRVSIFLPSVAGGGAERVMVNLARGFARRGLEVDLVLASAEGPYLSEVDKSVSVIDLHSRRVSQSLPALMRYLHQRRPQTLISALDHANVIALMACRLIEVSPRTLISVQNTISAHLKHVKVKRDRILPLLMRMTYPWADVVGAVSGGVAKELISQLHVPAHKVRVVPNPVVTAELHTKADAPLDEHPWFASNQPPVVLAVGRLTAQKDFGSLVRAFAIVRRMMPVRLMILGEGEHRSVLEELVRDKMLTADVALPGFDPNPYKYMRRAAVFVLSSLWEGLPTVLIEALAVGTAVVSTDCQSGPAEILEGGKWGRLVPVGDVQALASAIRESLLMDALYDRKAAQQNMRERYGEDRVAQHYIQMLSDWSKISQLSTEM